jgi:carbon storage regulator
MLVLSRKPGQRIVIGPDVVLTLLDVRGDTVKLGFEAPAEVPIYREEVLQRIRRELPVSEGLPATESQFFPEFA